jgi:hypothetical protein
MFGSTAFVDPPVLKDHMPQEHERPGDYNGTDERFIQYVQDDLPSRALVRTSVGSVVMLSSDRVPLRHEGYESRPLEPLRL